MRTLLVVKSSILGSEGNSTRLVDEFVSLWQQHHADDAIIERDFSKEPIPHLSQKTFAAFAVAAEQRTVTQQAAVELSDTLTEEFLSADTVVLGLPMYNLGVPSCFKAYIDHIGRVGQTFRYTESGPVGLAGQKRLFVLAARGGFYWNTSADTQTPYINTIFGFFGIKDITYVVAEGLNISPEQKVESMEKALTEVRALFDD